MLNPFHPGHARMRELAMGDVSIPATSTSDRSGSLIQNIARRPVGCGRRSQGVGTSTLPLRLGAPSAWDIVVLKRDSGAMDLGLHDVNCLRLWSQLVL